MIVSGSDDKKVFLWDIKSGKLLKKLEGHDDSVLAIACNPTKFQVASGGRDNNITLWNLSYDNSVNVDMEQDINIDKSTDKNKQNDDMEIDMNVDIDTASKITATETNMIQADTNEI